MHQSSVMVSYQVSTLEEESAQILRDIFGKDSYTESVCLQDLIEWSGYSPITTNKQDLAQLVVYSEDKLRELRDIYYDVSD